MKDHPQKLSPVGYREQLDLVDRSLTSIYTYAKDRFGLLSYIQRNHPDLKPSQIIPHNTSEATVAGIWIMILATLVSILSVYGGSLFSGLIVALVSVCVILLYVYLFKKEQTKINKLEKQLGVYKSNKNFWDTYMQQFAPSYVECQADEKRWNNIHQATQKLVLDERIYPRVDSILKKAHEVDQTIGEGNHIKACHVAKTPKVLYDLIEKAANYTQMNTGEKEEFETILQKLESEWDIKKAPSTNQLLQS